ncbi:hypothetical protein G5C65_19305 [Streptomyces sp. SB3404]|uniref:Uncharacterized protein n=2 Tax=Streptomyces boncukensis TaxID=2711219 RepID=A0A6G4X1B9_9ACTN|nr:hypothetical protein [Streptomyces boncukensis]NGO70461.1 hypothetical protein [Streptomyces boncukensis]
MNKLTKEASSGILDIIDLAAKVTEPGPRPTPCSGYSEDAGVVRMRHPWSVYGVPVPDMEKAMDRLRRELGKKGWKIVKDGRDSSKAKSPQIVADRKNGMFSVDIRLHDEREHSGSTSLIEVTVVSDCFRRPKD